MTRAWVLAGAMLLTAVFCWTFKPGVDPLAEARATVPLEQLVPVAVGDWRVDAGAAAPVRPAFERARQFQTYDQVLERTYVSASGYRVMLSVAYGRQQSVGLQMHRPEVCYKAGGFAVEAIQAGTLPVLGRQLPVKRLFASMEGRPEPITYWRLLGNDVVADDMQFKLRQLRLGHAPVADGMLVRVSSIDADRSAAYRQQALFVSALASSLNSEQMRRLLGQP